MPKTPLPKFIKAPDVHLPMDFQLVAIRPLTDDGTMSRFSVVLAYSEAKGEYATWKYDHDFSGCDHGNYFDAERSKDAVQRANKDFMTRNAYCAAGGGLYVLNAAQIATLSEGLKQEVISRTEENKQLDDDDELLVENNLAMAGARRLYADLNGGDEMAV